MEDHRERPDQGESVAERQHRRYRRFDEEFKREAVRLSELPGKTLASVSRSLGIDVNTLGLWRKRYSAGVKPKPVGRPQGDQAADAALDPAAVAMQLELMELRKRLRETEMERDILKKAMSVFARHEPPMHEPPMEDRPGHHRSGSERSMRDRLYKQ